MNKRITPKERGLLKGAIRRVFSRSELRRKIVELCRIEHHEPTRPRVKKWGRCQLCKKPTPLYLLQIDHICPIIPLDTTLEQMSWDVVIDRVWCEENNLQSVCIECHKAKTKEERKLRKGVRSHERKTSKSTKRAA